METFSDSDDTLCHDKLQNVLESSLSDIESPTFDSTRENNSIFYKKK